MRFSRVSYQLTWGLFSAVLVLSLIGGSFTTSAAQSVSWNAPITVSPSGTSSWFPEIIADRAGTVHVAWASGVSGYDAVIYTNTVNGEVWAPINDVAASQIIGFRSAATRPAMVIDEQGFLHLTFVDTTTLYYSKVPVWNAGIAHEWTEKQVLSGNQTAYFSKLGIDSKGVIHLIFTQNFPTVACLNCYRLYYRQSLNHGDTWSEPIDISVEQDGVVKPQMLIDSKDNIHVVWESGLGGGLGQLSDPTKVKHITSYDGGKTWTTAAAFVVPENPNLKNITLGVDKNGSLMAVFWALPYDWVMYSLSNDDGKTWTDPLQIPEVWGAAALYKSNLDAYSMARDGAGNVHLALVARKALDSQTVDVLDVVWDGQNWLTPVAIAEYSKDVPEWPRIVVSKGNQINAVWFVRDEEHIWDSAQGRYRIWYAKGVSAASPQIPQPYPTFTPTVQPTSTVPTRTLEPNATVQTMPTYALDSSLRAVESKPSEDVLYTEQDYLALLGKALLPSLVFLAGAIAIAVIRKR